MAKKTPSFTADDFIASITANASNIAASEAAHGRSQEPEQSEQGRVGESTPPARDGVPSTEDTHKPEKPALPPAKTIIAFVPFEIDTKLAILSSQERISKKRIVLEALLDYLHKRDLLTADERDQWLQLPKEFGTPAKGEK